LSSINFIFLNNVFPYASLKQKNLLLNIKKKKPSVALIAGVFNTEIPNYMIKFDTKYGEEDNLLDNILIWDLKGRQENKKVITAEKGKILSESGSRYMTLELENGHYFEDHYSVGSSAQEKKKMPASFADFELYKVNIDISSLTDGDLDNESWKNSHTMYSINQLQTERELKKTEYREYVKAKSATFLNSTKGNQLRTSVDTLNYTLNDTILANFNLNTQVMILDNAVNSVKNERQIMINYSKNYKSNRKRVNNFDYEFYHRMAFSLSCLVLFFVGAPLGSLIRKGGFGLPMVVAIFIFVIYHSINTVGKNLVEESEITAPLGAWLSTIILLPTGLLLTRRAAKDKGAFNTEKILRPLNIFFNKLSGLK
jgi:lipopolysaccharide export system permease protein